MAKRLQELRFWDGSGMDPASALLELDRGLRSVRIQDQCESVIWMGRLMTMHPAPVIVNSVVIKLAELFRTTTNNFIRHCIFRTVRQCRELLGCILNRDAVLDRIFGALDETQVTPNHPLQLTPALRLTRERLLSDCSGRWRRCPLDQRRLTTGSAGSLGSPTDARCRRYAVCSLRYTTASQRLPSGLQSSSHHALQASLVLPSPVPNPTHNQVPSVEILAAVITEAARSISTAPTTLLRMLRVRDSLNNYLY